MVTDRRPPESAKTSALGRSAVGPQLPLGTRGRPHVRAHTHTHTHICMCMHIRRPPTPPQHARPQSPRARPPTSHALVAHRAAEVSAVAQKYRGGSTEAARQWQNSAAERTGRSEAHQKAGTGPEAGRGRGGSGPTRFQAEAARGGHAFWRDACHWVLEYAEKQVPLRGKPRQARLRTLARVLRHAGSADIGKRARWDFNLKRSDLLLGALVSVSACPLSH